MREFIGNPFQQEFEEDDELDEFEDVLRIVVADRLLGPPVDIDEEHDNDLIVPDTEDDDSDYIFENNDGYDSDDSREFEDLPNYELRGFSTDEDVDEELDYVTFPVSENHTIETTQPQQSIETTNKTMNQESSNSSSSDPEFAQEEDESWD